MGTFNYDRLLVDDAIANSVGIKSSASSILDKIANANTVLGKINIDANINNSEVMDSLNKLTVIDVTLSDMRDKSMYDIIQVR